jgi:hypothetical protein
MIFNLFKSKNKDLNKHIKNTFEIYLDMLKTVPDDEVGYLLDFAVEIKQSTSLINEDITTILSKPELVDKEILIDTLYLWFKHLIELNASGDTKDRAKAGALTLWYLSIGSIVFSENKNQGIKLWSELKRGYEYCTLFKPDTDSIKALETN